MARSQHGDQGEVLKVEHSQPACPEKGGVFVIHPARVGDWAVVFVELAVGAVVLGKGPAPEDGDSVGGA